MIEDALKLARLAKDVTSMHIEVCSMEKTIRPEKRTKKCNPKCGGCELTALYDDAKKFLETWKRK